MRALASARPARLAAAAASAATATNRTARVANRLRVGPQCAIRWQSSLSMAVEAPSYSADADSCSGSARSVADDFGGHDEYVLPASKRKASTRLRYELGQELGRGHYATVVEALDTKTRKKVAVKIMDKRHVPRQILENELAILEELSANGERGRVTPIMDAFEDEQRLYLVLELMRGGDFFDKVSRKGSIGEEEASNITRRLCFSLNQLHQHNILHRDVKLENLLLDGDVRDEDLSETERHRLPNTFKLSDLGFAKKVGAPDSFKNPAGTLGYVAPEVLRSRDYSPACDVWSAGVVLYMMLAGHAPFPHRPDARAPQNMDEQVEQELEAIEHGRSPQRWTKRLRSGVWRDVSQDAKDLVTQMLRVDPAKRIKTHEVLQHPWISQNSTLYHHNYDNYE